MLRELNHLACSASKSRPRKYRTFEKVLPREQGLSEGQREPGSCGGNTEYRFKVPSSGESSCSGNGA